MRTPPALAWRPKWKRRIAKPFKAKPSLPTPYRAIFRAANIEVSSTSSAAGSTFSRFRSSSLVAAWTTFS
jgi:hypothetical protein